MPPPLNNPLRLSIALLSAAAFGSALFGAVLAVFVVEPAAWMWMGFELVNAVVGVLGLLLAAGRFRLGPALALVCFAGTLFVGTVFGRIGVMGEPSIAGLFRDPWIIGRVVLAGGLCGCATVAVLSRSDRGWGLLIKGLVVGGVALAGMGAMVVTKGGWLTRSSAGGIEVVRVMALFVVAALLAVGISVGVHLVIRAFESGLVRDAGDR